MICLQNISIWHILQTNYDMARKDFPDFSKLNSLTGLIKRLPNLIGNTAVNFYKDSWQREGYIDNTISSWPRRKQNKGKARRILVKTGRLRRSVRYRSGRNVVTIYTDVPYAQVHNEGGRVAAVQQVKAHTRRSKRGAIAVRAHTRRVNYQMPQRKFMDIPGERISFFLETRLNRLVQKAIEQVINKTK